MSKIHLSLKVEDPSPETLLKEQNRLQAQGKKLLESELKIILESAGTVHVGGSYVYGLMIYPDLDLEIVSKNVTKDSAAELVHQLFKLESVRKLSVNDRVNFPRNMGKNPIRGYWLGIEIGFEDDLWNMDVWFQKPEWKDATQDLYPERFKNISDEIKIAILSIKHALIVSGEYDTKFFSADVYNAVLDSNVRTLDAFYSVRQ